jgi:transcription-repair coupling factor (superfamily II helicase)
VARPKAILERWISGRQPVISGIQDALLGFLMHEMGKDLGHPPLLLAPETRVEEIHAHVAGLQPAVYMPAWDTDPSAGIPPSSQIHKMRMEGIYRLLEESPTLITTIRGLAQNIPDPLHFVDNIILLIRGMAIPRDELAKKLTEVGYQKVSQVEEPGGFSIRGHVVDIFPTNSNEPIRLELWGNEIEEIRSFDPVTQTSSKEVKKTLILPAREETGRNRIPLASLLEERPLIICHPEDVELERENLLLEGDEFLPPTKLQEFLKGKNTLLVNSIEHEGMNLSTESHPLDLLKFRGTSRISKGMAWINARLMEGTTVYLSHLPGEKDRILHLLKEYDLYPEVLPSFESDKSGLCIFPSQLHQGFLWQEARTALITRYELLGKRRSKTKKVVKRRDAISSFRELSPGDYVVHTEHGVGQYTGLKAIQVGGILQEFMSIEYAQGDQLMVPITRLHSVQKYRGADASAPTLDKLGGTGWKKTRAKVQKAIEDYAKELIHMEAQRKLVPGHSFSPDSPEQREFEEEFPFEETPDQASATQEIKEDMESPFPMDRLLCGDVSYGKTEVAMRAAFKAVMDGKQVAVLVPTTILAEQHHETFSERFRNQPINIGVLSRFKSRREQREIIEKTAKGELDILIGTHRILSPDITFQDLGLVIIDEEHRFGVRQKDKLKKMKTGVDVLYLSATPIPRTLHQAISGLKQMSVMETPPQGRKPIKTYISIWNPLTLKQAVLRELKRKGRIFLVQPKIEGLEELSKMVERLVPQAIVAIAHGQMKEKELEEIMYRFMKGQIDILVSTPIVESGLDVPMANTLIVKEAHQLGLSQLYQLRGRVGRSRETGYAYFFIPTRKVLTPEGRKRLQALKEFAHRGSGLKLALKDMEIRGVGNLLGTQQRGNLSQVGFNLYCEMLERTIQELQGKKPPPDIEPILEIPIEAAITQDYLDDQRIKISIYKRISQAGEEEELAKLEEEMKDRFGPLPPPTKNLFSLARIKLIIKRLKGEKLVQGAKGSFLHVSPLSPLASKNTPIPANHTFIEPIGELVLKLHVTQGDLDALEKLLKDIEDSVTSLENQNREIEGVKV